MPLITENETWGNVRGKLNGLLPSNAQDFPLAPGQRYGQLATNCRLLNSKAGSNRGLSSRSHHKTRGAVSEIAVRIPGWYLDRGSSKFEFPNDGDVVVSGSVESPSGTYNRLYFDGGVRGLYRGGRDILSDFTAITPVAHDVDFWIKLWFQASSQTTVLTFNATTGQVSANGEKANVSAVSVTDYTNAADANSAQTYGFWPPAIIGRTSARSVGAVGDSMNEGNGDSVDTTDFVGIITRSVGPTCGVINLGQNGDSLVAFLQDYRKRISTLAYVTDAVSNYGNNDIANGRTAAQIKTDLVRSWTIFVAAGAARVWQLNYLPRTNSSNVTLTGWGPGSVQEDLNLWLADGAPLSAGIPTTTGTIGATRAGQTGHPLTGVVDVASVFQTGNSGVWANTGLQADWVHPNNAGYLAVAASNRFDAFKAAA